MRRRADSMVVGTERYSFVVAALLPEASFSNMRALRFAGLRIVGHGIAADDAAESADEVAILFVPLRSAPGFTGPIPSHG